MPYAWIIDKDYFPDEAAPVASNCNAAGVVGPRIAPDDLLTLLRRNPVSGQRFNLFDDDGGLMYAGRIIVTDAAGAPDTDLGEDHFGPLDDFGAPNAGCTYIQYRNAHGNWDTL